MNSLSLLQNKYKEVDSIIARMTTDVTEGVPQISHIDTDVAHGV